MFIHGLVLAGSLLPALGSPAESAAPDADHALTRQARRALAGDGRLRPFNLGVTVRDGAARLWGPVPSDELARRARECVASVPGVRTVVSELAVCPDEATGTTESVTAGKVATPPPLLEFPEEPLPAVADPTAGRPPGPPAEPERKPEPPKEPVVALMSPVSVVKKESAADPALAADALRRADPRYRGLTITIENGVARIGGTAKPSDVWELAEAVSQLAGIERVRLDRISQPR